MSELDDPTAYDFDLPADRIAVAPAAERRAARLLGVGRDTLVDHRVSDLVDLLRPGDLVVVNDARVSPVRLRGRRASGGAVEVFVLGCGAEGLWADAGAPIVAMTRSNRGVSPGETVALTGGGGLVMLERGPDGLDRYALKGGNLWSILDKAGEVPLPPYIVRRREELGQPALREDDPVRYQTVFAKRPGAVAAPTAGLHFDDALLGALRDRGVRTASVTLWVGIGTFAPVRAGSMAAHELHPERYEVPEVTARAFAETRASGGRVVAVGTTVVRTLEAAWREGDRLQIGADATRLFIRPGYAFGAVDALLTNFHLPRSTLLALVCAFGGHERVMRAYAHAVASGYRFYSYGDAMWLDRALYLREAS